jgi:hypothetical protein
VRFATSAVALMDCNASYADSAYRTDQMLRYHQLQFDMLEIVRRRLQADLNSGMTGIEADNRVAYYQRIYNEQTSDLARATVNGSNDQRLQQYEYMTRKQLEEQLLPSVPEVKPGDWQAGWFVGTGCLIPTGGISDLFNYAWLFNIGLSGGYKNLILKADISYGQPDIHNFTFFCANQGPGMDGSGGIPAAPAFLRLRGTGVLAGRDGAKPAHPACGQSVPKRRSPASPSPGRM